MTACHLELLVEERSMEAFLTVLLPGLLPQDWTFAIHAFNGKRALLRKIGDRLRGYGKSLPPNYRLVVLVDRDDDDCRQLKRRLERAAAEAGLVTASRSKGSRRNNFPSCASLALPSVRSAGFALVG